MSFEILVPSEREAPGVTDTFFAAMDINLLMHAQFPNPESKEFFRGWLFRDTMDHVKSVDKGVLVARDPETGKIASFAKWNVQRQPRSREMEEEADDDEFPDFCRRQYLGPYADLTKSKRDKVLGDKTYYRELFAAEWRPEYRRPNLDRYIPMELGILVEATLAMCHSALTFPRRDISMHRSQVQWPRGCVNFASSSAG